MRSISATRWSTSSVHAWTRSPGANGGRARTSASAAASTAHIVAGPRARFALGWILLDLLHARPRSHESSRSGPLDRERSTALLPVAGDLLDELAQLGVLDAIQHFVRRGSP